MSQRSPVIFVLLLAATLSVDAVAVWLMWTDHHALASSRIPYHALAFSQLSLLAIWVTFGQRTSIVRWCMVAGATLGVAWLTTGISYMPWSFAGELGLFSTHVLAAMILLWCLRNALAGRRITSQPQPVRWRFTVRHILALTAATGVVLAAWTSAAELGWYGGEAAAVIAGSLLLALGAVVVAELRIHRVKRWAAIVAVAGIVGASTHVGYRLDSACLVYPWTSLFLIQAIVLALWLELAPIIPWRAAVALAADAKAPPAAEPSQAG
jgi:hypothetical protein